CICGLILTSPSHRAAHLFWLILQRAPCRAHQCVPPVVTASMAVVSSCMQKEMELTRLMPEAPCARPPPLGGPSAPAVAAARKRAYRPSQASQEQLQQPVCIMTPAADCQHRLAVQTVTVPVPQVHQTPTHRMQAAPLAPAGAAAVAPVAAPRVVVARAPVQVPAPAAAPKGAAAGQPAVAPAVVMRAPVHAAGAAAPVPHLSPPAPLAPPALTPLAGPTFAAPQKAQELPASSPRASESGSTAATSSAGDEAPVDLSGSWVLNRVEGDFEALMVDAGVSWTVRKLAQGAGYGAGIVRHEIKQDGDQLEIIFKTRPGKTDRMTVRIDGCVQGTTNEDGTPVEVRPRWEGLGLCMSGSQPSGSPMQPTRRYLVGQELVCECSTSKGAMVAKRIFTRA
ncbi:unnamed protein product, partial [Prorocentrum cordatum]